MQEERFIAPWYFYFTTWVCIIILFFRNWFDIFLLGIITAVIGSYISFVDPGYYAFKVGSHEYKLEGLPRIFTVDMVHLLILLLALKKFSPCEGQDRLIITLSVMAVYLLFFDVKGIYKMEDVTFPILFGICFTLFYIIYLCKV